MNAPRSRTTPYAVLGLLSLEPMSGYEVRKGAASTIGHFWSESYGQVYPALRELSAAGLIRRRPGGGRGRRERQVYEITARGREALRRWRSVAPRSGPVRNELLLKLFFGDRDDLGPPVAWVEALLAEEIRNLAEFRRIRLEVERSQADHPSLPLWRITLSYGEHRSRAVAAWCRQTLKTLRAESPGVGQKGRAR
jgi:DNA-binding PadR family transcriptional regulator